MAISGEELKNEARILEDIYKFGNARYVFTAKVWQKKFQDCKGIEEQKMCFIEIIALLSKTLEDYAAYLHALKEVNKSKCMLISVLVSYTPAEVKISDWIKDKNDKNIQLMFGLNRIYKKVSKIKTGSRRGSLKDFLDSLKLAAELQRTFGNFYNKSKHGNLILSSDKIIKPDSKQKLDCVGVVSNNPAPNVIPFSEHQFNILSQNIVSIGEAIKELILVYAIGYNEFLLEAIAPSIELK